MRGEARDLTILVQSRSARCDRARWDGVAETSIRRGIGNNRLRGLPQALLETFDVVAHLLTLRLCITPLCAPAEALESLREHQLQAASSPLHAAYCTSLIGFTLVLGISMMRSCEGAMMIRCRKDEWCIEGAGYGILFGCCRGTEEVQKDSCQA